MPPCLQSRLSLHVNAPPPNGLQPGSATPMAAVHARAFDMLPSYCSEPCFRLSLCTVGSPGPVVSMVHPAPQQPRFLAPGDKLGKYDLLRQIAVGGMAELYLARTVGIEG